MRHALCNVRWSWFCLSALCFLMYQGFRAHRTNMILKTGIPLGRIYPTFCIQSFINMILPMWLGEAALVYLLRKLHTVNVRNGAASQIYLRSIDFFLFAIAMPPLILLCHDNLPSKLNVSLPLLAALFAMPLILLFLFSRRSHNGMGFSFGLQWRLAKLIEHHLREFQVAFQMFANKKNALKTAMQSAVMWALSYLHYVFAIWALGFHLSAGDILKLYILLFPIQLVPIKGIADLGTLEGSWFLCLRIIGLSVHDAVLLGFGAHVLFMLVYLLSLIVGLTGFALQGLDRSLDKVAARS